MCVFVKRARVSSSTAEVGRTVEFSCRRNFPTSYRGRSIVSSTVLSHNQIRSYSSASSTSASIRQLKTSNWLISYGLTHIYCRCTYDGVCVCGSPLSGPHRVPVPYRRGYGLLIAASTGIKAFSHHESRSVCGSGDADDLVGPILCVTSLLISVWVCQLIILKCLRRCDHSV